MKISPPRIFVTMLAIVMAASLVLPGVALGKDKGDEPESHDLTGSWQGTFTPIPGNPVQFPPVPALFTFNSDKTLTETDAGTLVPAPAGAFGPFPVYASPAHGIWRKIGDRKFEFKFVSILVNGGDGTLFGTGTILMRIQLSKDGDSFTGTGTFRFVDTAGNTLPGAAGPENISGRRIEF